MKKKKSSFYLAAQQQKAGWTIICNDRVVLHADKSKLTGWGEAGVPQYHTQFIGIAGIVIFTSSNAELLPITTTKRGVDGNSNYIFQLKILCEKDLSSLPILPIDGRAIIKKEKKS